MGFSEKTVYKGDDLEIRQIDEHTWHGNGHVMANEAIYIIEGEERAIVLDAARPRSTSALSSRFFIIPAT